MKIWITKYALTVGLFEVETKKEPDGGSAVYRREGAAYDEYVYGEGKQWTRTKEAAIARAEDLRKAKIKSLRKAIAKIEAMKF